MAAKRKYKKTQVEYAADYNVTPRAVANYMGRSYPLDDPERMAEIFAAQKNRPKPKGPNLEVDATKLTDEQLENPANEEQAKLYERILICRKLAHNLRESRRLVIPRNEVKAGEMRVNAGVKTALLALVAEIPALAGKSAAEMQKWATGWVHETLTALSNARGYA